MSLYVCVCFYGCLCAHRGEVEGRRRVGKILGVRGYTCQQGREAVFFKLFKNKKLINSTCGCGVDVRKKTKIVKAPSQKIYRHLADKN